MSFWVRRGIRQRQVDTAWPEGPCNRDGWNGASSLVKRVRAGRLRRGHACRCGVTAKRACDLCRRPLCGACAVRTRRADGSRGRAHPRCLVSRYGFLAVVRVTRPWSLKVART